MSETTNEASLGKKLLMRSIFVIGVILAIAILAFALVRILPPFFGFISNSFSSLFNRDNNELTIVPSKNSIKSDEIFNIDWSTGTTTKNSELRYTCRDGLSLYYIGSQSTKIPVLCERNFRIGGNVQNATLQANLKNPDSYEDLEIAIEAEREDGAMLNGDTLITVTNDATASLPTSATTTISNNPPKTTLTPKPTNNSVVNNNYPSSSVTPVYRGPADLVLSQVIPQNLGSVPVIAFAVTNHGGSASGTWTLRVNLPNNQVFNSTSLPSLLPGQTAEYSMSLGSVSGNGEHTVQVIADSNNQVAESNENNNTGEVVIRVSGGNNFQTSGSRPDLSVRITNVDEIRNDEYSVTFEVRNQGSETAEDWRYEAELPTEDNESYRSSIQPDLPSGATLTFTLRFDNVEDGYFEVEVDSDDDVNESSENNNSDSVRINN